MYAQYGLKNVYPTTFIKTENGRKNERHKILIEMVGKYLDIMLKIRSIFSAVLEL